MKCAGIFTSTARIGLLTGMVLFTSLPASALAADYKVSCTDGKDVVGEYTVANEKGFEAIISSLIEKNIAEGFKTAHTPTISKAQVGARIYFCVTSTR